MLTIAKCLIKWLPFLCSYVVDRQHIIISPGSLDIVVICKHSSPDFNIYIPSFQILIFKTMSK